MQETCVGSLDWEDPLEKRMASTPVFLPGKFHGQRSLAGYSQWGRKESVTTDWLALWGSQVALVVKNLPANAGDIRDSGSIPGLGRSPGEGNGNPLQYFCLENPMDREAWRAIVHRVATSWTWLKRLTMHTYFDQNMKDPKNQAEAFRNDKINISLATIYPAQFFPVRLEVNTRKRAVCYRRKRQSCFFLLP